MELGFLLFLKAMTLETISCSIKLMISRHSLFMLLSIVTKDGIILEKERKEAKKWRRIECMDPAGEL